MGGFDESALLVHRDGHDFAQAFTQAQVRWVAPGSAVVFTLKDAVAALTVELSLNLDPDSDVLTLSSRLTNDGPGGLDVQWLAAGVDAPAGGGHASAVPLRPVGERVHGRRG